MRQTDDLDINSIIIDDYASLLNCTTAVGASDSRRPLRKTLTCGLGLKICLWFGPPWFNYWFSFTLAHSRIAMSTRLCLS